MSKRYRKMAKKANGKINKSVNGQVKTALSKTKLRNACRWLAYGS